MRFSPRIVRDKNFFEKYALEGGAKTLFCRRIVGGKKLRKSWPEGGAKTSFCPHIVRAKKFSEKDTQKGLIKTPFSQRIVEGYFLIEKIRQSP